MTTMVQHTHVATTDSNRQLDGRVVHVSGSLTPHHTPPQPTPHHHTTPHHTPPHNTHHTPYNTATTTSNTHYTAHATQHTLHSPLPTAPHPTHDPLLQRLPTNRHHHTARITSTQIASQLFVSHPRKLLNVVPTATIEVCIRQKTRSAPTRIGHKARHKNISSHVCYEAVPPSQHSRHKPNHQQQHTRMHQPGIPNQGATAAQ